MTQVPVRRLLSLLSSQRRWIAAGWLLGFLAIAANVALISASAFLVSKAALVTNVAELALTITAVRVLAIGRAAFRYLERYVNHAATLRIAADVRVWLYAAIEPLAPARLATRRSGDLLARIAADVETLEDLAVRVVAPPVVAAMATTFACLLLGAFDPLLGIVLLAFLGLTGVGLPVLTGRVSRDASGRLVVARGTLQAGIVDQVHGQADLTALDQTEHHRSRVLADGAQVDRLGERLAVIRGVGAGGGALLTTICAIVVLGQGVALVVDGRVEGVVLALLPLATIAAFEAVQPLPASLQLLGSTQAAAGRLFELVDAAPPVSDPPGPRVLPESVPPSLEIRGLTFAYEPGGRRVLEDIDLTVPAGSMVAIVGPSGSGKSTLVNLLLRFVDYDQGEIRIDGRELHELRADDTRRLLGVVSQRVDLFDATIRDNLALADPDVTDEAIEAACRLAQVDEFVATLPDGYATRIGEDGHRLSGGERRRLAIARAIVKDAPVLIFDEATADVDAATERRLLESLRPFLAGRTTLVIAHRPAFVDAADAVVELRRGRLRVIRGATS